MRKIRIIIVTFLLFLRYNGRVFMNGFQNLRFDTKVNMYGKGVLHLGKRTTTYEGVVFSVDNGNLKIGDRVGFNRHCIVVCKDSITIGNHCSFGPNVIIYDHDHIITENGFAPNEYKTSPIVIGDNCWIAANVTILRGTTIGEGSIIGAGTLVKGNIPPYSLVTSDRSLKISSLKR